MERYNCVQPRYNLLFREFEKELFPLCKEEGVGVIVYNPLAGGFLTGKHKRDREPDEMGRFTLGDAGKMYQARYWQEPQFNAVEKMKKYFEKKNKSLAHVSLAWVLNNPEVTSAIVGASKPEQLKDNLKAIEIRLDSEETEFLNTLWYDLPKIRDPKFASR
jgi:aryl-alcohol dehydrogenase-like predicted oxidoreductase